MSPNDDIFDQVQRLLGAVSSDKAQANIERLEQEITDKRAEQQKWYALLGLKQQLGETTGSSNGQTASHRQLPLREAVRVVFNERGEGTTLTLADLREELRRRSWLGETENEDHRLQMAASSMVKRGELFRPKKGFYRLASLNGSAGESLSEAPSSASGGYGRHSSRTDFPGVGASSPGLEPQTRIPQHTS
jgi:hypothetical protein